MKQTDQLLSFKVVNDFLKFVLSYEIKYYRFQYYQVLNTKMAEKMLVVMKCLLKFLQNFISEQAVRVYEVQQFSIIFRLRLLDEDLLKLHGFHSFSCLAFKGISR